MAENLIITISREYGSGGREIGKQLASTLGITYYDKELLGRIAEESGLCTEIIEACDEKPQNLMTLSPDTLVAGIDTSSKNSMRVRSAEINLLHSIANEGPCVIIGRCADSVLFAQAGLVSLFITAPLPDRIKRVMRRNDLSEREAKMRITKTDKARMAYNRYYSNKEWGAATSYDLCINSGKISTDDAVEVIAHYVRKIESNRKIN